MFESSFTVRPGHAVTVAFFERCASDVEGVASVPTENPVTIIYERRFAFVVNEARKVCYFAVAKDDVDIINDGFVHLVKITGVSVRADELGTKYEIEAKLVCGPDFSFVFIFKVGANGEIVGQPACETKYREIHLQECRGY